MAGSRGTISSAKNEDLHTATPCTERKSLHSASSAQSAGLNPVMPVQSEDPRERLHSGALHPVRISGAWSRARSECLHIVCPAHIEDLGTVAHKNSFSRSLCAESRNVLTCFAEANHPRARRLPGGGIDSTPFEEGAAMRKQNHSIPPVFKHNGRPNNSVAPRRRRKCSNAQKHGVFAEPLILPGEDPREFEALHAALIEEWSPSGPSEQSRASTNIKRR